MPVQTASELILGIGQRPNAAIEMKRDQFRGDWMEVLDEKTMSISKCFAHQR
ncbi:hypothetical protein GP644_05435 [Parasedimentitalea maritima]|uniref:Uncharacterized protein n=1 Tax=Parasedimentitalea maritima TaxID=2578117 RepID=A0A6A4RLX7_9RHOB|nr:hypothetical protein GP644_05435 [Zongyanglinia marina]